MAEEHHYELTSNWVREKIVTIEIQGNETFEVATPPDFWPESPEGTISPEALFLASAASCYGVSLSGVAKRFHAEFESFHIHATADLKKAEYGWEFEKIDLSVRIKVSTHKDAKRMEKAAERAHAYCLLTNSMKCPVNLEYAIEE